MSSIHNRLYHSRLVRFIVDTLFFWMICLVAAGYGMPPHPELLEQSGAGKANPSYYMLHVDDARSRGLDAGVTPFQTGIPAAPRAEQALAGDDYQLLALLVDFADQPAQVEGGFFDSLMFDTAGRTVRTYFQEVSFGAMNLTTTIQPSEIGWVRVNNPYSYYVNGQNGIGDYPKNTKRLVEELVAAVDHLVDFSRYDNDGDGFVDGLVVIHSGRGAERTGSSDDIWSHQWYISPQTRDGVQISKYSIQPEYINYPGDGTIGVYCHELGHLLLGLPDLYDTDYTSRGVGEWCLMSFGAWTGPLDKGECPAHLNAWCKARAGFIVPTPVDSSQTRLHIAQAETSPTALKLGIEGSSGLEYFLVENRQRTGFDQYLPGDGLLIWHVDEARSSNTQEWRPGNDPVFHALCALEQADGDFDLEKNLNSGDGWDPFPGVRGATAFYELTEPGSDSYLNGPSGVSIVNISASADTMYADFSATLVAGSDTTGSSGGNGVVPRTVTLSQNYPNPFNPSTTITYTLTRSADVTLDVYDITGRKITTLVNGPVSEGQHTAEWNGTNADGRKVASGVYFYRVEADGQSQVKKMVLMK